MNGLHGIIFTYERRGNLQELGSIRSSASIPFGGRFRAVDFALSGLVNAGATDVGIILHGHYQSLLDHLGTGKDWDLSRKRGGLRLLPPFNYKGDWGAMPYRGHIEALTAVRTYLEEIRQDYVVIIFRHRRLWCPFNCSATLPCFGIPGATAWMMCGLTPGIHGWAGNTLPFISSFMMRGLLLLRCWKRRMKPSCNGKQPSRKRPPSVRRVFPVPGLW